MSVLHSPKHLDLPVLPKVEKLLQNDSIDNPMPTPSPTIGAWVQTTYALIGHCLLSIGITSLLLFYVDKKFFNLEERSPPMITVDGTAKTPYRPTQSDIVTILSVMLVAVRVALASWVTPLYWRAALYLMERSGLSRGDFKALLSFGVLFPRTYKRDATTFLIGTFLLVSLLLGFVSPLITGSISWVPDNRLASEPLSEGRAQILNSDFSSLWDEYVDLNLRFNRELVAQAGVGMANIAWGRDVERGTLKRVIPTLYGLEINSTIENATLPYFSVTHLEWISDPYKSLSAEQRNWSDITQNTANLSPLGTYTLNLGYVLLIPASNWTNNPMTPNITVTSRQLLVLYHGYNSSIVGMQSINTGLNPSIGVVSQDRKFYSFAWVEFSTGVGRCENHSCAVSSPLTIRNNMPIELLPNRLTIQALALAPNVAQILASVNSSIPFPLNGSRINDYVEALLVRSYAGAWNSLNNHIGNYSPRLQSKYTPSWVCLKAHVDQRRLYAWLGVQLLVTVLGAMFLFIQSHSKHPLIGNTVLTAFYLDTTKLPKHGTAAVFQDGGALRVNYENDRYKVTMGNAPQRTARMHRIVKEDEQP